MPIAALEFGEPRDLAPRDLAPPERPPPRRGLVALVARLFKATGEILKRRRYRLSYDRLVGVP